MDKSEFAKECLKHHNTLRALHKSPDLVLDVKLTAFAQDWADTLATKDHIEHREKNRYGENIFCGYSTDPKWQLQPHVPLQQWYSEISSYEFGDPSPENLPEVEHFTQLVWKNSKKLGVGYSKSKSGNIFVVCEYQPAGNVTGKFDKNVKPGEDADAAAEAAKLLYPDWPDMDYDDDGNAVNPDAIRVWSDWLIRVADKAACEWQGWLRAYCDLGVRLNKWLIRVRDEANQDCNPDDTTDDCSCSCCVDGSSVSTVKRPPQPTLSSEMKEAWFGKKSHRLPPCGEDDEEASFVTMLERETNKAIPLPRDQEEMIQMVKEFKRMANKYQLLYEYWLKTADRVLQDIRTKKTPGNCGCGKLPYFCYLQEEPEMSLPLSDKSYDRDCGVCNVRAPDGTERIVCKDRRLYFNLNKDKEFPASLIGSQIFQAVPDDETCSCPNCGCSSVSDKSKCII